MASLRCRSSRFFRFHRRHSRYRNFPHGQPGEAPIVHCLNNVAIASCVHHVPVQWVPSIKKDPRIRASTVSENYRSHRVIPEP